MKTLGLLGGTGYLSTIEYYRIINETINKRLVGLNFARCILYSFNYGEIDDLNRKGDRQGVYNLVLNSANNVINAGAEGIMLCANTMHSFADELEKNISVPIIHIAVVTARHIIKQNISKVALLGTKPTMEQDFYKSKLNKEGLEVLIPDDNEREFIQSTVENELLLGIFKNKSKDKFLDIIRRLDAKGADGIIIGCTEIPLLIKQEDINVPLFDTLSIHAMAAVDFVLDDK
jgi:aspartate racemase